jgi:hypothetical protein
LNFNNNNFVALILFTAPGAPRILAEDCSAENNSITVAWQPHPASFVEGFVLELDDGVGVATGRFRVSHTHTRKSNKNEKNNDHRQRQYN